MDALTSSAQAIPVQPTRRDITVALLSALALALGYTLIIGLSSRSWSHLISQWRTDLWFIVLVAIGFGSQMGFYRQVRRVVRGDGKAAAMAAGGTATSTTAMVACCLHHFSDIVPFIGLSGAATFLIQYKGPVVVVSLMANVVGITLMVRTLRHAQRAAAPACH